MPLMKKDWQQNVGITGENTIELVHWNERVYSTSSRVAFYDQPSLSYESFSRINYAVFYTK